MRIVFAGGGTAGHITPALAMADILRQKDKTTEIFFIGRQNGPENGAVMAACIPLYEIDAMGLRRSLSPKNAVTLYKMLAARKRAIGLLREIKPNAVIGTGGYVSWPVLSAAMRLGLPTAIHESNAYPGAVTRYLGRKCDAVMLGYPEAERHLRGRCNVTVTGTPVRSRVGEITRAYARSRLGIPQSAFTVLAFGGSLGASALNSAVSGAVLPEGCLLIHGTGRREFEKYRESESEGRRVLPYIDDMPLYLAAADVAITRCGAMTLAELCAAGLPAVLVPSPNVTANHQYENARALAECGGAILLSESDLSADRLSTEILKLRADGAALRKMGKAMKNRTAADGKERILSVIESLAAGQK